MELANVIHLGRLSLLGTGIVMGGVTLGAALAAFANPLPKPVAPAPWEGRLHPQIAAYGADTYYQSLPEDLYPAALPSSYVPASALTEMRWPDAVPMTALARSAPLPDPIDATPEMSDFNPRQLADRTVTVAHYAAIEQAAQADAPAEASADDPADLAVPVDPAAPPPLPAADNSAKVIHLAAAEG